jgi:glycosidase
LGEDFYENGVFHRRYGGDLQGVMDQLDYLARLGVNTIYFNPVFYARSLHKYDGNSFHHIDPHFGPDPAGDLALIKTENSDPQTWKWTKADRLFLDLIRAAHAQGMRVIIDGVFNHTGRDFFAFLDLRTMQEKSNYRDWYVVESYDDLNTPESEFKYRSWWGVRSLPEFANSADGRDLHEGPKRYILAATSRWMDPNGDGDPCDGIDGWRLDVANEVPDQFWVEWNRHVRALNPQAYTVAEIWVDASKYLERCGFSATMNYHGFAFLTKGFLIDGGMSPSAFAESLQARAADHAPQVRYALQNLIDSHDTDRVASMIVNARPDQYQEPARFDYDIGERASARYDPGYDVRKPDEEDRAIQRLVALFQFSYVGAPMIYYGTEAGMWGGDDPDDRKPMVWMDLIHDDETKDPRNRPRPVDKVAFDQGLYDYYQALIALRKDHPALRRGEFTVVATNDQQQTFAYRRKFEQDTLLVVLNRSNGDQVVEISLAENELPSRWSIALQTTDNAARVIANPDDKNVMDVRLPGRSGVILEAIAD